ncbi:MAG TPA: hypothetical protein VH643_18280, partial [Gemmataceae bacterium]
MLGLLELGEEEAGEGLSLEAAIERLVAVNADLAAKSQDIPKARADVLTAGLRSNPFLFVSVSNIPYGHFSPRRPASTSYDLTLIQPLDVNGKRGCRTVIRLLVSSKNIFHGNGNRQRLACRISEQGSCGSGELSSAIRLGY